MGGQVRLGAVATFPLWRNPQTRTAALNAPRNEEWPHQACIKLAKTVRMSARLASCESDLSSWQSDMGLK